MSESAIQPISSTAFVQGPTSADPIPSRLPTSDGERAVNMLRCMGDMVIHCTLAFEGTIDAPRYARAMRLLMDAAPHLGSQLVHTWWQPYWQRRTDLDSLSLLTLVETDDWEGALEAYMVLPFVPEQDPMIQARIFRSSDGHDTLCLRVNHVIADAGAAKEITYWLAAMYHTLAREPAHMVTPNIHGDRSIVQLLKQVGWRGIMGMLARNLRDNLVRFFPLRRRRLYRPQKGPMQPAYTFRHLSEAEGTQLKHFARERGVTVNDIVITALARGIFSHLEAPPGLQMRLTNTVDLRRYMPGRQTGAICNFSSFSFTKLGPWSPEEPFSATLTRATAEMNHLKKGMLGGGDIPTIGILGNTLPHNIGKWVMSKCLRPLHWLLPPAFTNMGKIDQDALPFEDATPIHGWLTASVVKPPYFVGGVSGFGSRLTISTGFCANATPREEVEALLEGIVKELVEGTAPQAEV